MREHQKESPLPIGRAFAVADQAWLGVTRSQVRHANADQPYPGVWGLELKLETLLDRCGAYLPRLKPGDAFSHVTALQLHGVPVPAGLSTKEVHVTSSRLTRPRVPGVVGHREGTTQRVEVDEFPVVTIADVWCQLATELTLDALIELGDMLTTGVRNNARPIPWCSLHELRLAVERRKGARGMARAREALELVRPGAESVQETRLRLLLLRKGFMDFEVGVRATDAFGQTVMCDGYPIHPDLADREFMIATEYEGIQHLTDQVQWERDIRRVRALEAAGWIVIRVTKSDLRDPRTLLREIEAAYDRRLRERRLQQLANQVPRAVIQSPIPS